MWIADKDHPVQDQAARLRQLVAARSAHRPGAKPAGNAPPLIVRRPLAHTVAVASGKGGVGKTNVAVNLAICLASRGLKVALLDLDMGLANADLLLDVRCPYNLSHVVSGLRPIEQVGATAAAGVFFIAGASGVESLADLAEFERQHLVDQTRRLEEQYDMIVLDCGAGISRNVLSFSLAADICLLVTTPEPPALTDAYAVAKVLVKNNHQGSIRLLVNLAESRLEAEQVAGRVAGVSQRFLNYRLADGGYLLQDSHVELAVRQRCPFVLRYPRCAASACMTAVANRLAEGCGAASQAGGFFRRVVGLFV